MDIASLLASLGVPPIDVAYIGIFIAGCALVAHNVPAPKNPNTVIGKVYTVVAFIGRLPFHAAIGPAVKAIKALAARKS